MAEVGSLYRPPNFSFVFLLYLLCSGGLLQYAKDTSTPVTPTGSFAKLRIRGVGMGEVTFRIACDQRATPI
jgi:hypothetical protein